MMKRKYLIIVNPISGTANKYKLADNVHKALTDNGFDAEIAQTESSGHAFHLAEKAAADGTEAVIAIGGDGTVNEVASAIIETPTKLGIIPCGSGNGLARHLGLPLDPAEALKVILKGNSIYCDYASANGRPYFCTFGVGFDARVSHAFSKCKRRGKIAYLRVILKESKTFRPSTYRVTTPDTQFTREALILAVCNSSQYGNNAFIAPHATLTDGLLDVTVVNTANPIDLVRNSFELFTGLITSNSRFDTQQAPWITIESAHEMEAHLDGEPVVFPKKIELRCHPKGLQVFCIGEPEFKPFITPFSGTMQDIQQALSKPFQNI